MSGHSAACPFRRASPTTHEREEARSSTRGRDARRRAFPATHEGGKDERSKSFGGNEKRRLHSHIGRQAPEMGRQWSPFWRLGDLSYERIPRRSEPDLCVANQRLVWAGHSALR